jgi:hypothetical protein
MKTLATALLNILKWPLAIVVALLTPAGAVTFWNLLCEAWNRKLWVSSFGIGFGSLILAWFFLRRLRFVQFWCTMEHELTHAFFAWITLVPVVELRTSDGTMQSDDGGVGHVLHEGGNWLITISPYFFPTASASLLVATWALANQPSELARGLLGGATAYSILSTWEETGTHQTDLQKVGFLFSWLLLPGANLLSYGSLLANELGGFEGTLRYVTGAFRITVEWATRFIH